MSTDASAHDLLSRAEELVATARSRDTWLQRLYIRDEYRVAVVTLAIVLDLDARIRAALLDPPEAHTP